MRHAVIALAATTALTSLAGPAAAQAASDRNDVRCLLVMQAIGRDPKQQEAASRGLYYYLGRLAARGGLARVEQQMLAEAKTLTAQSAPAELSRCGAELNKVTTDLQATNLRLQATIKAANPPAKK